MSRYTWERENRERKSKEGKQSREKAMLTHARREREREGEEQVNC